MSKAKDLKELLERLELKQAYEDQVEKTVEEFLASDEGKAARKEAKAKFAVMCEDYVNTCTTDELIHICSLCWQMSEASGMDVDWFEECIKNAKDDPFVDNYVQSMAFLRRMRWIHEQVKERVRSMNLPTIDDVLEGMSEPKGVRSV
jgi:hypothetical protein